MFQMPVSKEVGRIGRGTFGDAVYRPAFRFGERLALIDGDIRISHAQVDAASSRFARYLLAHFPQGAHMAMRG